MIKDHLYAWAKACSDMGIEITAPSALAYINDLEGHEAVERPSYSKEAFVDALVEFIVGDDVVSHIELSKFLSYLDY